MNRPAPWPTADPGDVMIPPLSIVIPSHIRADLLVDCLLSVTNHAPTGTEIIVVDDGSKGGIVSQTARQFVGTRIIRTPGLGFCAAANRGIAAATGTIVELLNDDTIVESGWAEPAIAAFDDPKIAAVAPLVLRGTPGDNEIIDSAGDTYDRGGFAQKRGHQVTMNEQFNVSTIIDSASGCAAFYRRELIQCRNGPFPESFGAYFEDVDLSLRLRRAGFQIRFVPHSRVWHRGGSSHRQLSRSLVQQQSCNEERLFWRNTAGVPSELLRHGVVLVGKAIRRITEGKLTPWLFGRLRAWSIEGRQRWMSSQID